MNYIAERRQEEKERRRAEILDAAEQVAAVVTWDDMTMDQVARKARLSRALLYVYFKDKSDLMYGLAERGLQMLRQHFTEALSSRERGIDQIAAVGMAYVKFSRDYSVYFDVMARCELESAEDVDPESNQGGCMLCGDSVHDLIVQAIERGIDDGSIRKDCGVPNVVGISLWGFMHGVIQIATNKANYLAHRGVEVDRLMEQSLVLATRSLSPPT